MQTKHAAALIVVLVTSICISARGQSVRLPPYLNPELPLEQRVDDLISRMTLEEKASQMLNRSVAIPRLKIAEYDWWNEALHGVARNGIATVYPEPIGLAATFDAPLIRQMAHEIGLEARAKHNVALRKGKGGWYEGLTFWSPNINIVRDPRWGRGQETYGEDPFLTGTLATQFVLGMQGDDPKHLLTVATPKHYAVHSGPEPLRHQFNAKVSRHDLVDTYLPAFRETIIHGGAASVMCAYNRIDGLPACANSTMLNGMLRGSWKFNGYVVSDCGAVWDIRTGHHVATTPAQAAAFAVKAGMDLECQVSSTEAGHQAEVAKYIDAVKHGLLSESELDQALHRTFAARFLLGMFDPPERMRYSRIPDSVIDSAEHRRTALRAARESMVLLKNDGILPLRTGVKRIAVVGPFADSVRVLLGNYNGTPSAATTVLAGMRKQFPRAVVTYEPGASNRAFYLGEKVPQLVKSAERALTSASQADFVVAVVGISSEMEGEEGVAASLPGFSGGDRTTLDLPTEEEDLLRAIKSTGKPLIVVLMNGSALSVNWAEKNANAILEAWYAGEEGGTAVAETLAGVNNPAGRLPITFYKGVDQLPDFTDYSMQNRTYRYFNGEPLYGFGYGLSYSKFEYKTPRLSTGELKQGETLTVEAEVKNVSERDGDEVVQLYLEFPSVAGAPLRALRGFRRIHIKAGQSELLKFMLGPEDLYMVNQDGHRIVAAGRYRLWVGGGQPGVSSGISAEFVVQQEQQLPD